MNPHTAQSPVQAIAEGLQSTQILALGVGMGIVFMLATLLMHATGRPHPWLSHDQLPTTARQWYTHAAIYSATIAAALTVFLVPVTIAPSPVLTILITLWAVAMLAGAGLAASELTLARRRCFADRQVS
jgi:archaellum biogenesis protein FlaJ (TadC family)